MPSATTTFQDNGAPVAPLSHNTHHADTHFAMTDSSHRVHGVGPDEVTADWPPLREDEIDQLLSGYPRWIGDWQLVWHSPRPLSAAALVETAHHYLAAGCFSVPMVHYLYGNDIIVLLLVLGSHAVR